MDDRRSFFKKSLSGIAFCSCGLLDAMPARAQTPRAPVVINGTRAKTIDVHAHCLFHDTVGMLGPEAEKSIIPPTKGSKEHFIVIDERLTSMDVMGIDMQVLSINPFWYTAERELAAKIVAIHNEKLADLCAQKPDRFAAFASLSLHHPDLAVKELEKAVKSQGLKGAAIGATVAGKDFSDPMFNPVWAKAEELGAVLFIHPYRMTELNARFKGNGWLQNTIGNPLDTTIALQHLIFEGTLDRYPGLKVLAAHGGGYLPSYAPRSDHACFVSPQNCDASIKLEKQPTEYLDQLYFDSLVFTPEALRHLVAQVGASQLMIGTDQPIPWEEHPIDPIMATPGLSDAERLGILGGNAAKLLNIKI